MCAENHGSDEAEAFYSLHQVTWWPQTMYMYTNLNSQARQTVWLKVHAACTLHAHAC